jgi:hypothetical protein
METNRNASLFGLAPLNAEQLSELSALEKDFGVVVIALKPTVPLAQLTPEQVSRLQKLEKRQGIIALACQK